MTYLYLITHIGPDELEGPIKVGISENPPARLASLQAGSATKLILVLGFPFSTRHEARTAERRFHNRYKALRLLGEWFDFADPVKAIASVASCLRMPLEARVQF